MSQKLEGSIFDAKAGPNEVVRMMRLRTKFYPMSDAQLKDFYQGFPAEEFDRHKAIINSVEPKRSANEVKNGPDESPGTMNPSGKK